MPAFRTGPSISVALVFLAALLPAGAAQTLPELDVSAGENWWASTTDDAVSPLVPIVWEGQYQVQAWTPPGSADPGVRGSLTLPLGVYDASTDNVSYAQWLPNSHTILWRNVEPPAPGSNNNAYLQTVPFTHTQPLPVTVTRTFDKTLLTADVSTQTVTLTLTLAAPATQIAPSGLSVDVAALWNVPDGISETITGATAPAGFSAIPGNPGSFAPDDASALVVGHPYQFTATVQVDRSGGALAKNLIGNLYFKPTSQIGYYESTDVTPVNGTGVSLSLAPGVTATFKSDAAAAYQASQSTSGGYEFSSVATAVGPVTPTQIMLTKGRMMSISGLTTYEFNASVDGQNIIGGTITTPASAPGGSRTYSMEFNHSGGLDFNRDAMQLGDLAGFVPGTYQFVLRGSDGGTRTVNVVMPDTAIPQQSPILNQANGLTTTQTQPTISWQAPTDPGVNLAHFEICGLGGQDKNQNNDYSEMLAPTQTSFQVPNPFDPQTLTYWVDFGNVVQGTTADGIPYMTGAFTETNQLLNIVAAPARSLAWAGPAAVWDASTANWTGSGTTFITGDAVTIGDAAAGSTLAIAAGGVQPGSVVVNVSSQTLTLTGGPITGPCNVTKQGAGTLKLASPNSLTGTVTVQGGALQLNHLGALGGPGGANVTLMANTTLALRSDGNGTSAAEALAFGNDVTVEGATTINVDNTSPLSAARSKRLGLGALAIGDSDLTVTGAHGYALQFAGLATVTGNAKFHLTSADLDLLGGVSQSGSLTKDGTGNLTIDGPQSYESGSVLSVQEGLVTMDSDAGASGSTLTVEVGGVDGKDAAIVFNANQELAELHLMAGGTARMGDGCRFLILDTLEIDGFGPALHDVTLENTPEPATLSLLALGGLGALLRRRRS